MKKTKVVQYIVMMFLTILMLKVYTVPLNAATSKTQENQNPMESYEKNIQDEEENSVIYYDSRKNCTEESTETKQLTIQTSCVKQQSEQKKKESKKSEILFLKERKQFNKNMEFLTTHIILLAEDLSDKTRNQMSKSVSRLMLLSKSNQQKYNNVSELKNKRKQVNSRIKLTLVNGKEETKAIKVVQKEERERIRKQTLF